MAPGNYDSLHFAYIAKDDGTFEAIGTCGDISLAQSSDEDACVSIFKTTTESINELEQRIERVEEKLNKEGERNMDNKVLNLYYERKQKQIKDKYTEIAKEEYEKLPVVKEYNAVIDSFKTTMAEMADRYNNEELKSLVRTGYENTFEYALSDNIKVNVKDKYRDELNKDLKELELLVEEVRAQLSISDDKDYQIEILKAYDILDKKGKLNI